MNGTIKKIKDSIGNFIFPVTRAEAVFVNNNTPLSSELDYISGRIKQSYLDEIRVCSYNSESLAEGIATIRQWIKNKKIHYMGLQEIQFFTDPLNDLKFLDFEYPLYSQLGWGTLSMSVFNASSFNTYEIQTDTNPSLNEDSKRGLIKVETYIRGKKVSLYNTHIMADSTGVEVQAEIAKVIQIMDADTNPYKILTGDFNVVHNTYFNPFLTNYKICNGKDGVWIDTYKHPAYGTTQAIDNIIVSKNIDILNVERDEDLTLSDHWGLIADIVLR